MCIDKISRHGLADDRQLSVSCPPYLDFSNVYEANYPVKCDLFARTTFVQLQRGLLGHEFVICDSVPI